MTTNERTTMTRLGERAWLVLLLTASIVLAACTHSGGAAQGTVATPTASAGASTSAVLTGASASTDPASPSSAATPSGTAFGASNASPSLFGPTATAGQTLSTP